MLSQVKTLSKADRKIKLVGIYDTAQKSKSQPKAFRIFSLLHVYPPHLHNP